MNWKDKLKSKTVWTAIIGAILAGIQPISQAWGHPIEVPAWVYAILASMGFYGLRDAIGNKGDQK